MKLLKRIAAAMLAVAAVWFGVQARRHEKKQTKAAQKARELEETKGEHTRAARGAREEARAHAHDAEAALSRGRARIERLEDRSDPDFADRVRALNRRLRHG
jgi:uncharacterized protein YukE